MINSSGVLSKGLQMAVIMMAHTLFSLLAQVKESDLAPDKPRLQIDGSTMTAWIIIGVLVAGILLITFKTSKRNHTLDNQ